MDSSLWLLSSHIFSWEGGRCATTNAHDAKLPRCPSRLWTWWHGLHGWSFYLAKKEAPGRFDRALCNGQSHGVFPHDRVTNAEHTKFDHKPVFVHTEGEMTGDQQRAHKNKFESRWLQEENMVQLVLEAWERIDPLASFAMRTASGHAAMLSKKHHIIVLRNLRRSWNCCGRAHYYLMSQRTDNVGC